MPIYEFMCENCLYKFEEICPMGTNTHQCPECGRESRKLISNFSYRRRETGNHTHATGSGCSSCSSHQCSSCHK